MEYNHDSDDLMDALGITEADYNRIIQALDYIFTEYRNSDKYSGRSYLIELLEKAAHADPLLLRYVLFKQTEYMLDPLEMLEDSGAKVINLSDPAEIPEDCPEEIREFITRMINHVSSKKIKKDADPIKH